MKVDTPYFNIHDIALVLVVFQSALLTVLLFAVRNRDMRSSRVLALFLLSIGLEAADTLLYWCIPLKNALSINHPWSFFIFKGTVLLQGPLLYFYVRSTIYRDYPFSKKDLAHLAPFAAYPIFLAVLFHQMGPDNLTNALSSYHIYTQFNLFKVFIFLQPILIIGYCVAALLLLIEHSRGLMDQFSNLENVDRNWLKMVVFGFLFIWVWNLFVHLFGTFFYPDLAPTASLIGNYLDFVFINCLVFYNLLHTNVMRDSIRSVETMIVPREPSPELLAESTDDSAVGSDLAEHFFRNEDVEALADTVKKEKLYLVPDLTLDQLAARAGISPRIASQIINRHFQMCFFDFINSHRVAEAKILLVECPDKNILEVSEMAGFNSKSSFHRFFRRYADSTPSEYRRIHSRPR
jgi:AraC-like DNA-binding protein